MAFKMNRSIIKGTPMHQKAKAKAKSIVAKGPVGPDASLVEASRLLGEARSRTPKIDFTMKPYEVDYSQIEFGERKPKVKKEKQPKVKKDRLSLKDRLKNIKENLKTRFDEKKADVLESIYERNQRIAREKEEKNRIQTEKDAAKLEKDKLKQAELDKKEIDDALALEKENEKKLKDRLEKEQEEYEAKKKAEQMAREPGRYYEEGSMVTDAVGSKAIRDYSPEQLKRIEEEGMWSEEQGRNVLPEEIVDGKFESKAQGEEGFITQTKPITEDTTPAPTPTETVSKEQKALDRKYIFSNRTNKQRMIDKGYDGKYAPKKDTSPVDMRDDRIFNGAIKGGKVQQNMIKSGYIPR